MADALNFWSGWARMLEIAGNAFLFYVLIIIMVRLVGKRTTSELNNFDWIINVAVGSLAASGILLRNVATLDAVTAIIVLAACQYLTTLMVQRSKAAAEVIKAEPTLLTHKGDYLRDAMERTRISEEEIRTAPRQSGVPPYDASLHRSQGSPYRAFPHGGLRWELPASHGGLPFFLLS